RRPADAQAQRVELYRRARPWGNRAPLPREGRARLPGVQRDQRHDHAEYPDPRGAGEALPEDADHARNGRVRGTAIEPQGARGPGFSRGARLAPARERLRPSAAGPRSSALHSLLTGFPRSSTGPDVGENSDSLFELS